MVEVKNSIEKTEFIHFFPSRIFKPPKRYIKSKKKRRNLYPISRLAINWERLTSICPIELKFSKITFSFRLKILRLFCCWTTLTNRPLFNTLKLDQIKSTPEKMKNNLNKLDDDTRDYTMVFGYLLASRINIVKTTTTAATMNGSFQLVLDSLEFAKMDLKKGY